MFKRSFSNGNHPLTMGGIELPLEGETLHWLLAGTTGAGKTTAIQEMLAGIRTRGERCIVCDPNGSYLSHFGQSGDMVMNPFDSRSPGWSIFNELRRDYDAERLARSVVPDGQGDSAAWHGYAQTLLAEILRALVRRDEMSTHQLIHWASIAPASELGAMLAGTSAAGLFDQDAAKALASTRFVLASYLAPMRHLRPGVFSLRRWLEEGTGAIYLTWRADMQSALAPLVATWVDVLANAVLSLPPDPTRRIWLIVDELAAVGKLNSLESSLTLGRKHGLAVVAGLQSTAQLDRLYGREAAIVLRSCFRNLIVLSGARSDPETCEILSRALGERELVRIEENRSLGSQGNNKSVSARQVRERMLLPSEIAGLPNFEGYLAMAGSTAIHHFKLAYTHHDEIVEPYIEESLC